MLTRRSFLAGAASGLMSIGSKRLNEIGLQLYTVRTELRKDFEGTLARIATLGYADVEFAGYYDRSAADIRALLDRHRLKSNAAHIPIASLRKEPAKVIEDAKTIGHRYIICPWLDPAERKSLDHYRQHAKLFNEVGKQCRNAGIQLGYHNHDFEFVALDGVMPYDLLLKETDPALVKMELDLYWIARGGQDALAYFEKHPRRFELAHIKDMSSGSDKAAVEVGSGTIDFKKILARADAAGVKHYYVEQDQPKTPLESIATSIAYLRRLEF